VPSKTSLNRNIWVTGRRAPSPLTRDSPPKPSIAAKRIELNFLLIMTLSSFQSLAPRTLPIDLHVALIMHRMFLFLPVHSFLLTLFVYFLQALPTYPAPPPSTLYLQASSECTPSKLLNPLFKNELFLLTPLTLLLASTSLIHSTHGLVARMDYSFTRASSIFQKHLLLHCIWTSCENTMTHHSSDTPALPEPSK